MEKDAMDPSLRRQVLPAADWQQFLEEGKAEFERLVELKSSKDYSKDDFEFIKTLGMGAFGRVLLARMHKNGNFYAIKVLEKAKIVKTKQIKHAKNEKRILQALNHPFCVYLEYSFMDNSFIYFALPFITGGEMFTHMRKMKRFDENLSRFYGAQVLIAFEYLHYCDMIFRDLKPENILIDSTGYLKITDFGFCKVVKGRTYTLCGTPEYLAPEIILSKGYGKAVDWWSYGVLLYEMSAGYPPFHANDPMKIYEKVVAGRYSFPKFFSAELRDLIHNVLQVDLSRRYGNLKNGVLDIKEHQWFNQINWLALLNNKVEAPFVPNVKGAGDASNFEPYKEATMEVANKNLYAKEFEDF